MERTKALRRMQIFRSRDSYVTFAGHVYLAGIDMGELRRLVFSVEKTCGICGQQLPPGAGDLEHKVGGLGPQRCDCFRTRLADGSRHSNVRRTHGMFDVEDCHRKKHHRE